MLYSHSFCIFSSDNESCILFILLVLSDDVSKFRERISIEAILRKFPAVISEFHTNALNNLPFGKYSHYNSKTKKRTLNMNRRCS